MNKPATSDLRAATFGPGGFLSPESVATLRAHPGFPAAMRAFASGIVGLYRGNRILNMLINDRGRMLIGYIALYLHAAHARDGAGAGFGVGELKALCSETGAASPGRTTATIALMRLSGYLASASAVDDRRRHLLVPTERLIAAHRDRWNCQAAALAGLFPDVAAALVSREPGFEAAFVRDQFAYLRAGVRPLIDSAPELGLFGERNAGLMILFSILLSGEPGDTIPPKRPVRISISALAQRFSVSRVHVRTLLRDAEAAGLIRRIGERDSQVELLPPLADAIENFLAAAFLFVTHCARLALAEPAAPPREAAMPLPCHRPA